MNTLESKIQTYLSFRLKEELFAINVSQVINILEMRHITKIPKTPSYMKGVINLRGTVLPVVDLRIKFGMPKNEPTVDTSIIVLNIEKHGILIMLGILVDSVKEVLDLNDEDISDAPVIGTNYNEGFIQRMYRIDDHYVMILNINRVFSTDTIIDVEKQYLNNSAESKKEKV